jgi:hypothetical protein
VFQRRNRSARTPWAFTPAGSIFSTRQRGIRAMTQSINEERKETLNLGDEEGSLVRRAFTQDPSKVKWLKVDFLDFLSTIDLRVALFLPREQAGSSS